MAQVVGWKLIEQTIQDVQEDLVLIPNAMHLSSWSILLDVASTGHGLNFTVGIALKHLSTYS